MKISPRRSAREYPAVKLRNWGLTGMGVLQRSVPVSRLITTKREACQSQPKRNSRHDGGASPEGWKELKRLNGKLPRVSTARILPGVQVGRGTSSRARKRLSVAR